jgi:hypothetical protein
MAMEKSKADFINDILIDKRLDLSLKEKFIELTSKEILRTENENKRRIEDLENKMKASELISINKKIIIEPNKKEYKGKHKPKDVADFMKLFEDREGLKYLTHDFDESANFDIQSFLEKSKKVFDTNSKKYSIPTSLYSIINQFAFVESPKWGYGGSITEGWSSPKWIKWFLENKKHLKRSEEFEKIISAFRDYTKIETPKLKKIIDECILEKFGSSYKFINLSIKDADKVTIYTHVDDFKSAFKLILDGIKKRIDISNEITIECLRKTEEEYYRREIRICHHNSFPAEPLDEFIKKISEEQKGELGDAIKKMRGYCNWSIESIWDNQPIRVNILQENTDLSVDFLESFETQVAGFTHILTFYQI